MKRNIPPKSETTLLEPLATLTAAQIHVPVTEAQFAAASADIMAAGIAGFDTESKPTFVTGDISQGPHLVQFALADKAYLFQVHLDACRPWLVRLLESPDLLKVGFGLSSDRGQIRAKLGVTLAALLDLGSVFSRDGYHSTVGARAAVAIVLQRKFHKSKKVT
ncbi:MAG: 3'-5' exonuclease, partial [Janthinobacterium lividum]